MKNVLITGGAGFIGSNLSLKLLDLNYNVTVLDNLSNQIHGDNPEESSELYKSIKDRVCFINGDVRDRNDWKRALDCQDAVIHLAAETGTGQSMYEIDKYVSTNINGTALFLDIITNEKHTIKKIIVASSRAIYGEGKYYCEKDGFVYPNERKQNQMDLGDFNCKCPICDSEVDLRSTDEDSRISPKSIYGVTKLNQEQMILAVGASLGIPSVALRYQNVYGPGQSLSNPYTGILSIFSTQIKNNNNINIFEDGKESRDFVYIDDVVKATILALENDTVNCESINIGCGRPIDVITVAMKLREHYKSQIDVNISGNYRLGDIRHNYADLSKANKLLNFQPSVDFEKGIENFCNWVTTQKIEKDNFLNSIVELKKRGLYK